MVPFRWYLAASFAAFTLAVAVLGASRSGSGDDVQEARRAATACELVTACPLS